MYHMCSGAQRPEEDVRYPTTGVTGGYDTARGYWESHPGPL